MNIDNNISVGTRETGEIVLVLKWTTPTIFYFKTLRVIQIGDQRKMFTLLAAGLNFVHYLFSSQNNSRQCIIEGNKWTCCTACTFENANTKERLVSPRHQHRAEDQSRCWSGLAADRDRHESRANHYNPCRTDRLAHDRKHTYGAPQRRWNPPRQVSRDWCV